MEPFYWSRALKGNVSFLTDAHHVTLWSSCLYLFTRSDWAQPLEANWFSSFSPGVAPCWAPATVLWAWSSGNCWENALSRTLRAGAPNDSHVWIYFIQFETQWACNSSHIKPVCFFEFLYLCLSEDQENEENWDFRAKVYWWNDPNLKSVKNQKKKF